MTTSFFNKSNSFLIAFKDKVSELTESHIYYYYIYYYYIIIVIYRKTKKVKKSYGDKKKHKKIEVASNL